MSLYCIDGGVGQRVRGQLLGGGSSESTGESLAFYLGVRGHGPQETFIFYWL